jgi:hypothetical protein
MGSLIEELKSGWVTRSSMVACGGAEESFRGGAALGPARPGCKEDSPACSATHHEMRLLTAFRRWIAAQSHRPGSVPAQRPSGRPPVSGVACCPAPPGAGQGQPERGGAGGPPSG